MSTYSNRLQPALQNLLQHVVRLSTWDHRARHIYRRTFFDGRKSFVKPVTQQKTCNYYTVVWFLHPRSSCTTKHISMDVQRMTSNASCVTISGGRTKCVRWKNRTTRYILPRHWLYGDFLSFIVVELARFFNGALQLQLHKIVKMRLDTEQWAIHGFHFQSL